MAYKHTILTFQDRVLFSKELFFYSSYTEIYVEKEKRIDPYRERGAMMTDMMLHGSLVSLRSCQLEILLAS